MYKKLFTVLLICLLIFCFGCAKNVKPVEETDNASSPTPHTDIPINNDEIDSPNVTEKPKIFNFDMKEIFYMDDIGYCVNGITLHPPANESDTTQLLEIDISIYNGGSTVLNVVPTLFFKLTYADNNTSEFKMGSGNTNILMGDIRPGKTLNGVILYDIPRDTESFLLTVNNPSNNLLFANVDIPLSAAGQPIKPVFTDENTMETPAGSGSASDNFYSAGIGESITTDIVTFSVDSFSIGNGEKFVKPDEGNCFINLCISIKNISDKSLNILPPVLFRLIDSQGNEYSQNMLLEGARSLMINIEPQSEVTGNIYYEIPESLDYAELEFKPDMTEDELCVVDINIK